MTGREIFEHYAQMGQNSKPGSDAWTYAQTLRTALYGGPGLVHGRDYIYTMLEEAERTGQRLKLIHPIPWDVGPSDPQDIILSPVESADDYTTAADQTGQKNGPGEPPTQPA